MECEAKTETQHREHKGLSTENAEKEADSPHLRTTRMCPRERGGRHWEITEEKKTACKDALPNLGQAGDAKWAEYRAARNLGYRGQKKRPDRIGAHFYTRTIVSH